MSQALGSIRDVGDDNRVVGDDNRVVKRHDDSLDNRDSRDNLANRVDGNDRDLVDIER